MTYALEGTKLSNLRRGVNDLQLRSRGMIIEKEHPKVGKIQKVSVIIRGQSG